MLKYYATKEASKKIFLKIGPERLFASVAHEAIEGVLRKSKGGANGKFKLNVTISVEEPISMFRPCLDESVRLTACAEIICSDHEEEEE